MYQTNIGSFSPGVSTILYNEHFITWSVSEVYTLLPPLSSNTLTLSQYLSTSLLTWLQPLSFLSQVSLWRWERKGRGRSKVEWKGLKWMYQGHILEFLDITLLFFKLPNTQQQGHELTLISSYKDRFNSPTKNTGHQQPYHGVKFTAGPQIS